MNEIKGLSNERLEQEIASFYVEGARVAPGVRVRSRVLDLLWEEFDWRVGEGLILVE